MSICENIAQGNDVSLSDMIWANKLGKANRSALEMLQKARRYAFNPEVPETGLDAFMIDMGLGDPDPTNHRTGFSGPDDIVDWFSQDKTDDWRQRD